MFWQVGRQGGRQDALIKSEQPLKHESSVTHSLAGQQLSKRLMCFAPLIQTSHFIIPPPPPSLPPPRTYYHRLHSYYTSHDSIIRPSNGCETFLYPAWQQQIHKALSRRCSLLWRPCNRTPTEHRRARRTPIWSSSKSLPRPGR